MRAASIALTIALAAARAGADDFAADPSNYTTLLAALEPGDTLHLAAGTYTDLLYISGLSGTEMQWISIEGPATGEPAVFVADPGPCCNTIEITDSSYVAIRNITVDGTMVDGAFGLSAKDGSANTVHHITVEGCTFRNHDTSQQNVAISTKTPTWGWVIRANRIVGAGTGMYLGNSDGSDPFVGGLIEGNLVMDTIGYNVQIKWQQPRPSIPDMPTTPSTTVIRDNVFVKTDRPSPDGDRPSLLVGGFPDTGPGSEDRYEIYGNFFFHNPRESLIQASGRVTIHDNVLVDVAGTAILLADHDLPLRQAFVYNNTIYSAGTGIALSGSPDQGAHAVGNLVFSPDPISGSWTVDSQNLSDSVDSAPLYVASPSIVPGEMDFYPLPGRCQGIPLDLLAFSADADHDLDYNRTPKAGFTFRGAYAGEGANPGWRLDTDLKGASTPPPPDGEPDDSPDASSDPGPDASGNGAGGCSCTLTR